MVKLKVKVGTKGQIVIPKAIRDKLSIEPGKYLLIDEKDGKILIEKLDVGEVINWLRSSRKKIAKDVYKFSLEDEF
jgi:AbrB family looped-hinge helix DNA binding protein